MLREGAKWKIGDGNQIDIFFEQWIPNHSNPYLSANLHTPIGADLKVAHLFNPTTKLWREPLFRWFFPNHMIDDIKSIHIPLTNQSDARIWPFSRLGEFSVKLGYFRSALRPPIPDHTAGFSKWP